MNPIDAPLQFGDSSPEVVNLQDALLLLCEEGQIEFPDSERGSLVDELRLERERQHYGEATYRALVCFRLPRGLGDQGDVDTDTADALNKALAEFLFNPDMRVMVSGMVQDSNGKPQPNIRVSAFIQEIHAEEQHLDETKSDENGMFEIAFGPKQYSDSGKGSIYLRLLAVDEAGDELASSEDTFKVGNKLTLNLTFPAPPLAAEWVQIDQNIRSLLADHRNIRDPLEFAELTKRDLDLIASDTDLNREHIELFVLAFKLAKTSKLFGDSQRSDELEAEVYYGLLRQGLSTDFDALIAVPESTLKEVFTASLRENIISARLHDGVDAVLAAWRRLKALQTLRPASVGAEASFGDLLNTMPETERLPDDRQLQFARLYQTLGSTDALWEAIAEVPDLAPAAPDLKRTLALAEITQAHPALMSVLQDKRNAAQPDSIEFMVDLQPTELIELVYEHGVPADSGLGHDEYIEKLQSDVEARFPMQTLSKQLERKLGASERFPTRKVLDFLKTNPDFDLRQKHVEPYLHEKGIQDDSLREAVLQLTRIDALTRNSRETGLLLEAGFGSATQMIHEGKPALELKLANRLSPERIDGVYAAAENVVTAVTAVGTAYIAPLASGNAVFVIPTPLASSKTLDKYPSLRSLFGDLDYCECRHCQSMLGPAAYLADLMHFLQRSKLTGNYDAEALEPANNHKQGMNAYLEFAAGGTVLGALLQRRPDLADLELSCENTDTKIPYIDLVMEILENAVALPVNVPVKDVADIDIDAEFAAGRVHEKIAEALHKTNITIGKKWTVMPDNPMAPVQFFRNWIIKDGSRRWAATHWKQQVVLFSGRAEPAYQVKNMRAAVKGLQNGGFNDELRDKLSQGLPILGAPEIAEVRRPYSFPVTKGWMAKYTRAIAIRITMGSPVGAVEILKLDGTAHKLPRQYPNGTLQIISRAFAPDITSNINLNVAQLLDIPANELYQQTWNTTENWWELKVVNTALIVQLSDGLNVTGLTHQNSSIREHLQSSSENRNPIAYDILSNVIPSKNAEYPWNLPFDLWLEETRAFLEALGLPRAQLIDIARPQSRFTGEATALEVLGLSKSEADLMTPATASTTPWIYWGLTKEDNVIHDHSAGFDRKGSWLSVLAWLSMLLQQSGLSHREYLDLLQTKFVRQPKLEFSPPDECRTSMISLLGLSPREFTDHLSRVHVFTRLWRKLGWSIRDVDLALAAFGSQLTPTVLQDLALLKRLQAGLGLSVSTLVACIDTLDTQVWTDNTEGGNSIESSRYNNVFQRQSLRAVSGFEDFAAEKLANGGLTISKRVDFIGASLGIRPDLIKAWMTNTTTLDIADPLNLGNLSRLYAAAVVCRALGITPDTLPQIVKLFDTTVEPHGANPFRTLPVPVSPDEITQQSRKRVRALFQFMECVKHVRQSGFDFATLIYLLQHSVLPGKGNEASTRVEQHLTQTLVELRAALQSGTVLGDVSADNVKRQLARLGWYSTLVDDATGSDGLNYHPGVSVKISALPEPGPAFPPNLRSKFTYRKIDQQNAVLECAGSLKIPDDFTLLENLSIFPAAKITSLRTKYETQLSIRVRALASLLHITDLANLPIHTEAVTGLTASPVIPKDLKDRLKFVMTSPGAGKLTLTGWLSDAEKGTVTSANPLLSTALNSLQAKALLVIPAQFPPLPLNLTDAEQLLHEPDVERRYRTILLQLVSRLELDLLVSQLSEPLGSDPLVVEKLLTAVKVNNRSARDLLTDSVFLRSDHVSRVDRITWPDQYTVLELLGKIATIADRLSIKPEQLDWIMGDSFTVMDVTALPTSANLVSTSFDDWRKLVDLFHLRDVLLDGAAHLSEIHNALKLTDTQVDKKGMVRTILAQAFECDSSNADAACSKKLLNFGTDTAAKDYKDPSRLLELAHLLQVGKLLGVPCNEIAFLINPRQTESEAQLARNLFAASIDADEFPERLRPISNRLRNLQRDALVAYLIHHDKLADSNELFDRYLIDVEMDSCMLTSRIKQAISSVQLFVQRCLLNLERSDPRFPEVSPSSIDTRRWQWMKSYRVWEANRKIFLYPENWIEPELRDDKTEIFRAFESDLQQSEITHETALLAFRKYLDKMGDIANLTVVSMFEEQVEGNGSIVHLVGRDNSTPYKHYYRQWKLRTGADFGTWTAWEEISAQLDSEHVLVFLYSGSVYLAWPTISAGQKGNLKWKVVMNLAKRTAAGWTKLKKGRGEIEIPMVPHSPVIPMVPDKPTNKNDKDERTSLAFRIKYNNTTDNTVSIEAYGPLLQAPGQEPNATLRETISDDHDPAMDSRNDQDNTRRQFGNIFVRDPFLNLNLRVLASYSYEYDGKLKHTHYELAKDLVINITVTSEITYLKQDDSAGGYVPVERNPLTKPKGGVSIQGQVKYIGPSSGFVDVRLQNRNYPNELDKDRLDGDIKLYDTLVNVFKITVEVPSNEKYKTSLIKRVFSISKGSSFTWQEDFIFELKDDPKWLPSGPPNLAKYLATAGSFTLKDDDSLELEAKEFSSFYLGVPFDTENFMSGYREVGDSPLFILLPGQSLIGTPGQHFVVQAASNRPDPYSTRIYAYRDDRFSLLFWSPKTEVGYEANYRVVPFSTGGMRDLTRAVTKGRLMDAVALQLPTEPPKQPTLQPVAFGANGFTLDTSVTDIKIDFDKVPSGIYNWEVFFHNPLLVATQLSQAQRFEEAQRWFHLIFDPTTNDAGKEKVRYWRFLPFRDNEKEKAIDLLLADLAQGIKDDGLVELINEWEEKPFRPHLIARQRRRSYQFAVVQKYLENLIAWGDQLFRRDTIESMNEATQLYVLAAKILGKRPVSSPRKNNDPKSYRDIYRTLDNLSNTWIPLEASIVTSYKALISKVYADHEHREHILEDLSGLAGKMGGLYFCVPGNEKLSEYWDTVEDRLFKIRHCMNIEGVERQLPLFEPPIDPALLVRATAAGLDIAAVLSGMQVPLPLYRFNVMAQKALELCGEVRALGNALLSALEKKDAEQLSLLRSSHEIEMLKLVRAIKEQQQEEAEFNLEALQKTRALTVQRYLQYQRLMGKQNVVVPAEGEVAMPEPSALQIAPPSAGDTDTEGLALVSAEAGQLGWLNDANNFSLIGGSFSAMAGILHMIPDQTMGATLPVTSVAKFGGSHLGSGANAIASVFGNLATNASFQANRSSIIGGHQRRYDEWQFQSNTAAKELEQIDKQILANQIRVEIAKSEITNHDQQIKNSQEVDEFMRDKFTNQQLYSWMVGQISSVYFRTYQLAHDIAKRAERTYRFELGLKDSSFIEFGYWDSLKKGLLAGERLYFDLKRMDSAYLDKNKREYEITKHIALMQLDPLKLLQLKVTGQCEISLPETLMDLDFPGHYLRRIKSVSLTIPCVTGPYSGVPCTLTLLSHSIRHSSNAAGNYARDLTNDDPRFIESLGAIQSIVTSSAQNDSGMFETNLRDERYLPFEGAGVISMWRLELATAFPAFDYATISDVILHIRYTAREGGDVFRNAATNSVTQFLREVANKPQARLFSLRHEFPTEWHRLQHVADNIGDHIQTFALDKQRFPFMFRPQIITINSVEIFGVPKGKVVPALNNLTLSAPETDGQPLTFKDDTAINLLVHRSTEKDSDTDVEVKDVGANGNEANWTIRVKKANIPTSLARLEDLLVLFHYSVSAK